MPEGRTRPPVAGAPATATRPRPRTGAAGAPGAGSGADGRGAEGRAAAAPQRSPAGPPLRPAREQRGSAPLRAAPPPAASRPSPPAGPVGTGAGGRRENANPWRRRQPRLIRAGPGACAQAGGQGRGLRVGFASAAAPRRERVRDPAEGRPGTARPGSYSSPLLAAPQSGPRSSAPSG